MAKPNSLIAKQNAERMRCINEGMRRGEQFALDCLQISLHRLGWGYSRMRILLETLTDVSNHYFKAFEVGDEQEYIQECMDRELADLIKGNQELIPFAKRYPLIKKRGL